jgi:hypothetical protein
MFRTSVFIGLLAGLVSLSAVLTVLPLAAQDTSSDESALNETGRIVRADIQASNGVIHVI